MTDPVNYINYGEKDFIADPFFQEWILNPDAQKDTFWSNFLENNPGKKQAVEDARAFIKNILFKQEYPDDSLLQQSLLQHLEAIEELRNNKAIHINRFNRFKKALQVAAVVGGLLLLFSAIFIYNNRKKDLIVKTEYGKIKSVMLPDSSTVVLNANSEIKYSPNWKPGKKREVWLDGEAFFEVKHLNADPNNVKPFEQFLLHTSDITIEVLGTSFNVRHRRGKSEVVLQSGKIKVIFNDRHYRNVFMIRGDIITYDPEEKELTKATTIPENYTAWKEKKLILNNPTVNEIIRYLEDNFGRKIILEKSQLGTIKVEGPIMVNDLDDALFILSTVLSSDITEKNNTLIISPR